MTWKRSSFGAFRISTMAVYTTSPMVWRYSTDLPLIRSMRASGIEFSPRAIHPAAGGISAYACISMNIVCERKCGNAEQGDDARAKIDGHAKPPTGGHDAQRDGDNAHRQIGQQIEGGQHAAALVCR